MMSAINTAIPGTSEGVSMSKTTGSHDTTENGAIVQILTSHIACISAFTGDVARLSKCHQLLSSIGDALKPNNLCHLQATLPYVTAMLENALQSIESTLSEIPKEQQFTNFEQSFKCAPGQNHDKQLKFYRTTQKCGRKRQDTLK